MQHKSRGGKDVRMRRIQVAQKKSGIKDDVAKIRARAEQVRIRVVQRLTKSDSFRMGPGLFAESSPCTNANHF